MPWQNQRLPYRKEQIIPITRNISNSALRYDEWPEGFRTFELYRQGKIDFLQKFYPFADGIPSHDTFARLFMLINPKQESWIQGLRAGMNEVKHIVFDEKNTSRFF